MSKSDKFITWLFSFVLGTALEYLVCLFLTWVAGQAIYRAFGGYVLDVPSVALAALAGGVWLRYFTTRRQAVVEVGKSD